MGHIITTVLENGERTLHSRASKGGNELLAISDGLEWRGMVPTGDEQSAIVPYGQVEEFMKNSSEQRIFIYHTHPQIQPLNYLSPPSPTDLVVNTELKKVARRNDKIALSRVVEKHGIWEFNCDYEHIYKFDALVLENNLRQTRENGPQTVNEQSQRIIEVYRDFGAEVTFRQLEEQPN